MSGIHNTKCFSFPTFSFNSHCIKGRIHSGSVTVILVSSDSHCPMWKVYCDHAILILAFKCIFSVQFWGVWFCSQYWLPEKLWMHVTFWQSQANEVHSIYNWMPPLQFRIMSLPSLQKNWMLTPCPSHMCKFTHYYQTFLTPPPLTARNLKQFPLLEQPIICTISF